MKHEQEHPVQPNDDKAVDKAGVGQTDQEKGIVSKEDRQEKRKELLEQGKATKAARFHHGEDDDDDHQPPLHLKDDD